MSNLIGKCGNCGLNLKHAVCVGESGLYNPGVHIDLCEPCFLEEDVLITEGTNFHPEVLDKYYATYGLKRPKLYSVMAGAWV